MIKNLRKLLGLCNHKWKIIKDFSLWTNGCKLSTGHLYILQCEHCGNMKRKEM